MEKRKTKLLFICAANYGRSPTGADLVNSLGDGYEARSAGVFVGAVTEVTQDMLNWADTVFVMQNYMKDWLARYTNPDKIAVLDIPDRYGYGEPKLIDIFRAKLLAHGIDTTRVVFKPTRKVFCLSELMKEPWL